jgi:hypothetical protein
MLSALRWVLVLPAALGVAIAAYFLATLVWNVVRAFNIVPQGSVVDFALASLWINGLAAALGVFAGARAAPRNQLHAATVAAALLILLAVATLVIGVQFRDRLSMSLPWHIFSSLAWIGGALAALIQTRKDESRRQGHPARNPA